MTWCRRAATLPADGVALLVTGGIAAMRSPFVARALRRQGAQVVAFVSTEALRYVTAETFRVEHRPPDRRSAHRRCGAP